MLDHCCRQSYVEFLVWEWWRIRFLWSSSCLSREWTTQLPAQVDLEFLHSASVTYQPLGWATCCSAGTWKAEGGVGAPGRQAITKSAQDFGEQLSQKSWHMKKDLPSIETDTPGTGKSTCQAWSQKKVMEAKNPRWFGVVDMMRAVVRGCRPFYRAEKW